MSRQPAQYIPQPKLPILTSHAKSYQVVASFLSHKTDKDNLAFLTDQLKNLGNNTLTRDALTQLYRAIPFVRKVVWGNTKPAKVEELGNGDNRYYDPKSLELEVNWAIQGLLPYSKLLGEFVFLRNQVESCILLGQKAEADELLRQSVSRFGYSVWYYEMRLTIFGSEDRIEDCFSLLTQVNEQCKKVKGNGVVPLLLQGLSNRSLRSVSPLHYDNILISQFKRNRTAEDSNRLDYYLFRLNYYQYSQIEDVSVAVAMEQFMSVIDRYTMLLYVLRSCYANQAGQRPMALRFAQQLYHLSNDSQLLPFIALSGGVVMPESYYDKAFVTILDNYYTGQYAVTADLCRSYLSSDPSNFYVVKIYCRSLMFLGQGYQPVCEKRDALLNTVAFYVYHVMSEKEKVSFLDQLNGILKNIYGLKLAAGLDHFVKSEQNEPHSDMLHYFSMTQFDPFFINAFDDEQKQTAYLEQGLKAIPGSVAIQYRKNCVERIISDNSPVVSYIRDVDNAKITFERKEYEQALRQWRQVFDDNHQSIPTSQTAVEYIFRSLVALGTDYRQEAVRFYVDCFIENPSFVSKVNTSQFMVDMKQSRYKGLRNDLDLMIFVFLNAEKYPQKQFVLERYCKFEHVTYPSELIKLLQRRDRQKVELFFSILLTDDILYHHYKLRSTIDVLDEKLKIVNFLKSEYPDEKLYADTFTELMHELVAYRGMNKLDDSKIYVNEDAVMKYELCDIEPLYERFRKQAALARQDRSYLLVSGFDAASLTELLEDAVSFSNDAVADVANDLFCVIRRAFLRSRFGLGTYLSTRIRHGVFEGEMRSFLERLDLILSTDQGAYVGDTHWHRQYQLDRSAKDNLTRCLSSFSRSTDELISSFKDGVIQIRVDDEDPNGGEFCYAQPLKVISERLMKYESETTNVQEFCHKVMEWLWEITEDRLAIVREKVETDLKPTYTQNLHNLESSIQQFYNYPNLQRDLHTSINMAREELTTHLAKVGRWFYRQEAKLEDFRLSDHIQMAFDTTGKYSPDVHVRLDWSIPKQEPLFRSQYSASMFDLLTIFFSNIFKYSREEFERLVILDVSIDDSNIMHMHWENKLRDGINEDAQNRDFQERINDERLLQKEKGTGLAKAMNIVRYDFGDPRNTYTIVAQDTKCLIDVHVHLSNMVVEDA